jgi:hypothetical protein
MNKKRTNTHMFDRSWLPPARFEFVVIADTHYMIDPTGQQVEFTSRRRQTARTEYALQQVAALLAYVDEPLVIHMGDIIQEFPERPTFAQARDEALAQIARHGLRPRWVAGNHDVGDKPDPTMPASWVTSEFLADYHARFGRSWYSWDQAGLHFVGLNSQIMNSALPAAAEQAAWLAADLAAHDGQRIFLFLHLPPFLHDPAEPDLGHYDNLGEPARRWLLDLVQRHRVELLFAAHIHWAFYNAIGQTRYHTVPSVAFTRPGFSELFSSPPPAEQGRDDVGKLGFFLVRVHEAESRVHFVRTGGTTTVTDTPPQLLTGVSADLPHSPLGVVARHAVAPTGQVPAAWPSTIRQPVRNDYGFLALLELGARHLQIPAADLVDPVQRARLAWLRDHGVALTAQWLYDPRGTLVDAVLPHQTVIDAVEVSLLGSPWPDDIALTQLKALIGAVDVPITLSCVIPNQAVVGKQHNRSQIGYTVAQLAALDQRLAAHGVVLDRVGCRLAGTVADTIATLQSVPKLSQIGGVDWRYPIPAGDETAQTNGVAAAYFGLLPRSTDRLFIEPLVDLDRTMDIGPGLLDRTYNPRPAFHVLRHLNTLLYSRSIGDIAAVTLTPAADQLQLTARGGARPLHLVLPTAGSTPTMIDHGIDHTYTQRIGLCTGHSTPRTSQGAANITEPTLFCGTI